MCTILPKTLHTRSIFHQTYSVPRIFLLIWGEDQKREGGREGGCCWGSEGSGVSIWPCTRGVFLPEINEETWYQQVMCNKHAWLMSLKKNHLRDTLSWSGNQAVLWWMLSWVQIHTPLAHGTPSCLPNCLGIERWFIWSCWFIFLTGAHLQLYISNKLLALFLMMFDRYWYLTLMTFFFYVLGEYEAVKILQLPPAIWCFFLSLCKPQRLIHSGSKSFLRLSVAWYKHIHHPQS